MKLIQTLDDKSQFQQHILVQTLQQWNDSQKLMQFSLKPTPTPLLYYRHFEIASSHGSSFTTTVLVLNWIANRVKKSLAEQQPTSLCDHPIVASQSTTTAGTETESTNAIETNTFAPINKETDLTDIQVVLEIFLHDVDDQVVTKTVDNVEKYFASHPLSEMIGGDCFIRLIPVPGDVFQVIDDLPHGFNSCFWIDPEFNRIGPFLFCNGWKWTQNDDARIRAMFESDHSGQNSRQESDETIIPRTTSSSKNCNALVEDFFQFLLNTKKQMDFIDESQAQSLRIVNARRKFTRLFNFFHDLGSKCPRVHLLEHTNGFGSALNWDYFMEELDKGSQCPSAEIYVFRHGRGEKGWGQSALKFESGFPVELPVEKGSPPPLCYSIGIQKFSTFPLNHHH